MFKHISAVALTAAALAACSVDKSNPEDVASLEQEVVSCSVGGLEWKPFLAHLAYDSAEDMGHWEFTTDLEIAPSGDRLKISAAGYARCDYMKRYGCPAMTAGLAAQDGDQDVQVNGKMIISPNQIRSMLVSGFKAQKQNEDTIGYISDGSEPAPYTTMRSPTRTGLQHSLTLTDCAVTVYDGANYTGASQCLRAGNYRMADLKADSDKSSMNDRITSIKVKSGYKVTLYENDQFTGSSNTQTGNMPGYGPSNDRMSSLVVSATGGTCSAVDTYKVTLQNGGNWTDIRAKLVTLGYMRGNDVLDVRIDLANGTIDVDPFNVDFIPPSQIGGTTYGVEVKSPTAETWRSTDDPAPAIFPVGASCKKKSYGSSFWSDGIVKSMGSYRYCYL